MTAPNERLGQYPRDMGGHTLYEEASGRVSEAWHQSEDLVRRHPASSALVTFGVGFGLGLLLTTMLLPERRRSWRESYIPEGFSRRRMSDAVSRMLPDALARYLGK
ncbi:MAG: hypothetical protein WD847_11210 [Pirellulales bacterium]